MATHHSPLITFVTGASRLRVPNPIPVELIGVLLLNPVVNPDGVFSSVEAGSLQIQTDLPPAIFE